jgi:serine/threonine-protein kinase RIO1
MDTDELRILTKTELECILHKFHLPKSKTKEDMIKHILLHYNALKKYISYDYIKQLGYEGRDGKTFLAKNDNKEEFAIKIFKDGKSQKSIFKEAELQMKAYPIAPKVYEVEPNGKYIVMEKLDYTLLDILKKQNYVLKPSQQQRIIKLFSQLDALGVFHADPNPQNFMVKNNKWYMIDYGLAKPIKKNETPNMKYMPIGFYLQLKRLLPNISLEIIELHCDKTCIS